MTSRLLFLASVSVVSLLATPAFAQSDPSATAWAAGQADGRDGTTSGQTVGQATTPTAEGDIVVTACAPRSSGRSTDVATRPRSLISVVAEDVGKLPDNNVVEALQRVTGVQVTDRGQGEAAGIQIRGLPDALTTLNGRNIFTAAGQSFSLQDISANLI